MEFSNEIANIIKRTLEKFENEGQQDPFGWMITEIMQIMNVDENMAKNIANEIIEGIEVYKRIKEENPTVEQLTEGKLNEQELKINDLIESIENRILNKGEE
ncbi:hypothetical protein [Candidatus Kryptobacter tengchongensis]|uniref:Uncharacterized protein n=1 Tax=Kryptobacter tengchongensis TaxID=1643429 RepID=A0A916LJH8_KRYT1|nr:hypothetical protein [Candidatus Kryptobacter tengchongensis]CUT01649.1 hypothetical protein JGI25_00929 [Candidatus Kryptobacter tengchongensis]